MIIMIILGAYKDTSNNLFSDEILWLSMLFLALFFIKSFINHFVVNERNKTDYMFMKRGLDTAPHQLEAMLIFYWKRTHNQLSRKAVNAIFILMLLILLAILILNLISLKYY
jgi:hypothetical protein